MLQSIRVLIISIFRSKISPSILRKVIVRVTSGIFLFNNQYPYYIIKYNRRTVP